MLILPSLAYKVALLEIKSQSTKVLSMGTNTVPFACRLNSVFSWYSVNLWCHCGIFRQSQHIRNYECTDVFHLTDLFFGTFLEIAALVSVARWMPFLALSQYIYNWSVFIILSSYCCCFVTLSFFHHLQTRAWLIWPHCQICKPDLSDLFLCSSWCLAISQLEVCSGRPCSTWIH